MNRASMAHEYVRIFAGACLLIVSALASPQEYPAKHLRVVPFPAGGGSGIIACVVSQKLTGTLAQSVVVDRLPT